MDIPLIESAKIFLSEVGVSPLPPEWQKGVESFGLTFALSFFLWERIKECKRLKIENRRLNAKVNQLRILSRERKAGDEDKL